MQELAFTPSVVSVKNVADVLQQKILTLQLTLRMSPLKEQPAPLTVEESKLHNSCEYWLVLTSSGHTLEQQHIFCENFQTKLC